MNDDLPPPAGTLHDDGCYVPADQMRAAIAAEREACAKLLELSEASLRAATAQTSAPFVWMIVRSVLADRAAAIRARGQA
jgi:hypothetical protein